MQAYQEVCKKIFGIQQGEELNMSSKEEKSISDLTTCLRMRCLELTEEKVYGVGLKTMEDIRSFVSKVRTHSR